MYLRFTVVLVSSLFTVGCGLIGHSRAYVAECGGDRIVAHIPNIGPATLRINDQSLPAEFSTETRDDGVSEHVFDFRHEDERKIFRAIPLQNAEDSDATEGHLVVYLGAILNRPDTGLAQQTCSLISQAIS
jgi:hypothetical protein